MNMIVQLKRKKKTSSKQFQEALDALSVDFEKLQPRVDRVFTIGREEGLSDKEIGKEIRKKMKEHYSQQTIQNVFANYPEAKQKQNHKKVKESVTFHEEGICTKCGKPFKDPEEEIWEFHAEDFIIQRIVKAPRAYLETAIEHFYAESRKWKEKYEQSNKQKVVKPKSRPKQGTMEQKRDLLMDVMDYRRAELAKRARAEDE